MADATSLPNDVIQLLHKQGFFQWERVMQLLQQHYSDPLAYMRSIKKQSVYRPIALCTINAYAWSCAEKFIIKSNHKQISKPYLRK